MDRKRANKIAAQRADEAERNAALLKARLHTEKLEPVRELAERLRQAVPLALESLEIRGYPDVTQVPISRRRWRLLGRASVVRPEGAWWLCDLIQISSERAHPEEYYPNHLTHPCYLLNTGELLVRRDAPSAVDEVIDNVATGVAHWDQRSDSRPPQSMRPDGLRKIVDGIERLIV